jgi:hypothetical protein
MPLYVKDESDNGGYFYPETDNTNYHHILDAGAVAAIKVLKASPCQNLPTHISSRQQIRQLYT